MSTTTNGKTVLPPTLLTYYSQERYQEQASAVTHPAFAD
jgi:hypothetical protein